MNNLSRRRPSDLDVLRREMDRLFTSFLPTTEGGDASSTWAPRADVVETEDAYYLSMDLPGIDPEGVNVSFDDGALKVSGQREVREDHQDGRFHRIERSYGRFFRSFQLGNDVDPDGIEASFDGGVLEIRLAKAEARKPRQIAVRSGVASGTSTRSEALDPPSNGNASKAQTEEALAEVG